MSNLLLQVIIASMVGTALFLMILAIRPITMKLFSKTWHYYMGLVPVFFLLGGGVLANIPVGLIGQTIYGIHTGFVVPYINTAAACATTQIWYGTATTTQGNMHLANLGLPAYELYLNSLQPGWLRGLSGLEYAAGLNMLAFIWAAGAVLFVAVNVRRYLAYRHNLLHSSRSCYLAESPISVVISPKATTPMIIGFIKPIIVLPDMDFSRCQLNMILAHELVHFKRKDTWLKLVILIANAAHWFNPAAYF